MAMGKVPTSLAPLAAARPSPHGSGRMKRTVLPRGKKNILLSAVVQKG